MINKKEQIIKKREEKRKSLPILETFAPRQEKEELFPEHRGNKIPEFKKERERYAMEQEIPEELPTSGLLPYPIDTGVFIGEFESKKNIYLTFAHYINRLTNKIKELETRISELENA